MPNPYIHTVFDDCTADPHLHNSPTLNELAMYGRHYRNSPFINSQHGHALHPAFRANADVAMTYKQVQKNNRETIRDEWLHGFKRAGIFDTWLDTNTQERHFIAIHGADIVNPWEKTIYKGTCDPDVESGKLGCEQYWKLYGQKKDTHKPAPPGFQGGYDMHEDAYYPLLDMSSSRFSLSSGPWNLFGG